MEMVKEIIQGGVPGFSSVAASGQCKEVVKALGSFAVLAMLAAGLAKVVLHALQSEPGREFLSKTTLFLSDIGQFIKQSYHDALQELGFESKPLDQISIAKTEYFNGTAVPLINRLAEDNGPVAPPEKEENVKAEDKPAIVVSGGGRGEEDPEKEKERKSWLN